MAWRLSTQEDYGFEITQRLSLSLSPLEVTHLHAKSVKKGAHEEIYGRSQDYPSPPRAGGRGRETTLAPNYLYSLRT